MCGVVSMAAASACAGRTLSSNSTLAFLVFQLTATDFTPLTRLSEFCTVVVHGGQCSPVFRNVAFVGSAATRDEARKGPRDREYHAANRNIWGFQNNNESEKCL